MYELWQTRNTQHSAIMISQLLYPKIYVGIELIWLEGKTISGKKRTVVLGVSRNKDRFHITLIENNKKTYLGIETEPIDLDENFDNFSLDLFERIFEQLTKGIGVEI